jgi:phage protein D
LSFQGARYEEISATAIVVLHPKKGKGKPRNLGDRLLRVTYTDSGKRKTTGVEIDLRNDDDALFYDPDFRTGAVIGVSLGYPNLMVDVGQFVMKEPKGRVGIYTIQASERKRSKMARKKFSRLWENVTRSQAVQEVLANHFPASAIHVDPTTLIVESITQTDEHDWQFCARQAQLAHFQFYIKEDGVHWEKPRRGQKPARELQYVKNAIALGDIISYSFNKLGAGVPGRVTLMGRDSRTKKPFEVSVDKTNADDYEPLVETSGADDPEEGDREEEGDVGNEIVRNTGARNELEARELANQIYKENRYSAMELSLNTIGDPTIRSRTVIALWGLGTAFDGLWWVKQVKHTVGSGYLQEVQITREGLAKHLRIRGKKKLPTTLGESLTYIAGRVGGALHQYFPSNR